MATRLYETYTPPHIYQTSNETVPLRYTGLDQFGHRIFEEAWQRASWLPNQWPRDLTYNEPTHVWDLLVMVLSVNPKGVSEHHLFGLAEYFGFTNLEKVLRQLMKNRGEMTIIDGKCRGQWRLGFDPMKRRWELC